MPRLSTKGAMIARLETLDANAKFHAAAYRGFAHGLAVAGFASDHLEAAIDTDRGSWTTDADGRRVWEQTP